MNPKLAQEIQAEQRHGRQKYGAGPDDYQHDDQHAHEDWNRMVQSHNRRAYDCLPAMPREWRQHMVKAAGLVISAIESFDRSVCELTTDAEMRWEPGPDECMQQAQSRAGAGWRIINVNQPGKISNDRTHEVNDVPLLVWHFMRAFRWGSDNCWPFMQGLVKGTEHKALEHGDVAECSQCNQPIQFVQTGEFVGYWSHQKGNPHHPGTPKPSAASGIQVCGPGGVPQDLEKLLTELGSKGWTIIAPEKPTDPERLDAAK